MRFLSCFLIVSSVAFGQIPLWPNSVQGGPEVDKTTAKDGLIAGRPLVRLGNISVPTLTVYPPKGVRTGAAVVVFPGGGYSILAIDLEVTEVCEWLNSAGVTCVLVKYRVPGTGPYPKSAAALEDAQRSIGMVRAHATEWGVDPNRIGVLGFSAGGHLAAAVSTHFETRIYAKVDAADEVSCRPDFSVLVYPAYLALGKTLELSADVPVSDRTPPAFIVMAENDPVGPESAIAYFWALKKSKVPAEMHLYAEGGHGYGLRKTPLPVTGWPLAVEAWMKTLALH